MSEQEKIANIIKKRFWNTGSFVDDDTAMDIANEILQDIAVETLRDKFAGQALAGLLAHQNRVNEMDQIASDAYKQADSMLAERAK